MPRVPYSTGTVAVANGDTTVTLTGGTLTALNCREGYDVIVEGVANYVASRTDTTTFELVMPHEGAGGSGLNYAIRPISAEEIATATLNARTAELLEQLSVVQANGRGLFYRFDDGTTDSDHGAGSFSLNNADPALATQAFADDLDANGSSVAAEIASWASSTGPVKGRLWLRSVSAPSSFRSFDVTAVTDAAGYTKLALDYVGGSGSFSDTEELMIAFAFRGDQGSGYEFDAEVDEPDDLGDFEDEPAGYRVWIDELGDTAFGLYAGRSGVAEWNGTDAWSLAAVYTGPKGDQGDQGDKGWAPQLIGETDGTRRVLKLSGYVGGEGTPPTENVGQYLKADGTFTSTIGDAMDIRGPAGANGAGTVASIVDGTGMTVDSTDPANPVVALSTTTQNTLAAKVDMGGAIAATLIFG